MSFSKEETAVALIKALHRAGHDAYLAGGCVRDRLRGVEPKDFDIATSARPETVQSLFEKTIPVGAHFGVVVVVQEGFSFEVATFRSDGPYRDGRHPESVRFTTVEEDARRRDFTVNGLYWDIRSQSVKDFVGGQKDIERKVIRTIGDPLKRFEEDHLRMMRAVRFACQLGFSIEPATFDSIAPHASWIQKVSHERIRDELTKLMTSATPAEGIRLLDRCGLLQEILPEVILMKGVEQPSEYHPEGDVYIHTLMLLDGLKNAPIELAMGCLLHDISKPETFVRAADRIRFHGHDKIGAEKSRDILKRLVFSNDQIDLICELVAEHLRFKDAKQMRQSTLKRFLMLPRFDLHLELHRLDCLASHGNLDAYEFCKEKKALLDKEPPPPLKLVRGEDLIALGMRPGPEFSSILRAVEDAILEGTVTTKEEGIRYVKDRYVK